MLLPAPRRILLIQIRRLGDVILSAALLEDLHRAFPNASIDYLVGEAAAPLLLEHPLIAERIVLNPDRMLGMSRLIRSRRYDWVIDLQGNLRTGLLTRASGAPLRVGWRIRAWRLLYTDAVERGGPSEYAVRNRQRLLQRLGVLTTAVRPRLYLSRQERERGERDAIAAGATPGAPRVGFVLSTSSPARDWRVDGFAAVAAALSVEGVVPLIFETPGDTARVKRLREIVPGAVVVPPLDADHVREVRGFLAVLASCRVLVSGDTGPAHMADALGVPRVTIYGPTSPANYSPGLATTIAVRDERMPVARVRHWRRMMADGYDFTAGVTPDMVLEAVRRLLSGR